MLSHPIPELHQGCFPVREPVSPDIHLRVAVMQVGGYRPQFRPHRGVQSAESNRHLRGISRNSDQLIAGI